MSGDRERSGPPGERPESVDARDELSTDPGLCGRCRHLRLLRSSRSVFVRCALAAVDERFPRYPRLPVVVCGGFEEAPTGTPMP